MSVPKGDFIGFSYNHVHSSQLGIVHVSNGGRFTESLLPVMTDKATPIPGGDGTYYFNSFFQQRNFSISFAFDEVTEKQLREMKQLFGDKQLHDLVFDEMPFKVYQAKVVGMATIKYICFDQGPEHRLYKGEGDMQFVAYYPYGRAEYKTLQDYVLREADGTPILDSQGKEQPYPNINEWAAASGMLQNIGNYDKFQNNRIEVYNPGDIPTDWTLTMKFVPDAKGTYVPGCTIKNGLSGLKIKDIKPKYSALLKREDTIIKINSKNNLIEGYSMSQSGKFIKSGNIYNDCIVEGEFFKIEKNEYLKGKLVPQTIVFSSNVSLEPVLGNYPLSYNYYYL